MGSDRRWAVPAVVAATVAVSGLRWWWLRRLTEPVLFADEAAPFLIGRLLTGDTPVPTLGDDAFYHVGYALLLAPGTALLGPDGAFRFGQAVNILLLASVLPLTYVVCRRALAATPPVALAAAAATSLYPALQLEAGLTWSESAVLPAVLLTVAAFGALADRPGPVSAAGYAAAAVAAYAVHARLLPLLALAPLAGWWAIRRLPDRRRTALAGGLVLVVGVVVLRLVHAWMRARLYEAGPGADEGEVIGRLLEDPTNLLRAAAALVGQAWYLVTATYGLAVLGVVELARAARRSPTAAHGLVTCGALLAVTALFVVDPARVDQRIYGRYAETFLALLVAPGIVALLRRPPPLPVAAAALAAPVALAVVLVAGYGGDAFSGTMNPFNVLGLEHLVLQWDGVDVAAITATSVALAALLLGSRWLPRVPPAVPVVAAALAFTWATARAHDGFVVHAHEARRVTSTLPDGLAAVERAAGVDVDRADFDYVLGRVGGGFFGYQLAVPDLDVDVWREDDEPVPDGPWVFTSKSWPAGEEAGARLVVPESRVDLALWVLPGPEQDALADAGALVDPDDPLPPAALAATATTPVDEIDVRAGGRASLPVRVEHEGDQAWPAGGDAPAPGQPVLVRADWRLAGGDGEVVWASAADLRRRAYPGDVLDVSVPLLTVGGDGSRVPPGTYVLDLRLAQEGGASVPLDLEVTVVVG